MSDQLHTRTLDEDELVLVIRALDLFRQNGQMFYLRESVLERCDALLVRLVGEDAQVPS